MNFNESSLKVNFIESIKQKIGWDLTLEEVLATYQITTFAFAEFLGLNKSKSNPVALVVTDLKGEFKLGGLITYHPNEDENEPGNWSYVMTFNETDIPKNANVFNVTDIQFQRIWNQTGDNLHEMQVKNPMDLQGIIEEAAIMLKHWLDENAKDKEEVTLELPDYFVATVRVENGEKIFSITPDGPMKKLIKDDSALEV